MIYLDNAATTYPKPPGVAAAMREGLLRLGANPGRGGYRMSMETAKAVYACRETAAELFGADSPEQVVFTLNCTHAINIVLKGLLVPGDHVVVSDLEHNAVMRPLYALSSSGVRFTAAHVTPGDDDRTLAAFERAIGPNTRLIACTHVSNVFGVTLPIERIARLAHAHGAQVLVDAAQSAGVLPIRVSAWEIDYLCLPGHKGLYGPTGTGMLITPHGEALSPLMTGGTGSASLELTAPDFMPDRHEAGTVNTVGIIGLNAGMKFVMSRGAAQIGEKERALTLRLYDRLSRSPDIALYLDRETAAKGAGVCSFNIRGMPSDDAAERLAARGAAVRAGYHCAPAAHRAFATLGSGTIRASPSVFTTRREIDLFSELVLQTAKNHGQNGENTLQMDIGVVK